ncbi:MAG: helix-turn-helix domain-containing protein [Pyrinomonadaceae bacterium]
MIENQYSSPLVAKRSAAWEGIRLEHYLVRRGRFPSHEHKEHLAIVSLGGASGAELKTASGFHARCARAAGGVLVLPARRAHSATIDHPSEYVSLFLDPATVTRVASESGVGGGGAEIVERWAERDPLISNVARALLAELEPGGLGGRLYAESLANVLAIHLLRHYAAEQPPSALRHAGGLAGYRLRRVLDYMIARCEDDLSLADLAAEAGVSSFHFAREFKKSTGHAPHQYLIKLRVERAKTLLSDSEAPLAEVSLRAGFSGQSHFTRLFRRLTGVTPNTYRGAFRRPPETAGST